MSAGGVGAAATARVSRAAAPGEGKAPAARLVWPLVMGHLLLFLELEGLLLQVLEVMELLVVLLLLVGLRVMEALLPFCG